MRLEGKIVGEKKLTLNKHSDKFKFIYRIFTLSLDQ